MKKVKVKYALFDNRIVEKLRDFDFKRFPGNYGLHQFISQAKEEPRGMFVIVGLDYDPEQFVLVQLDCDEIHWNSRDNIVHGPDEECERKNCPYLNDCPISTIIMVMTDSD